MNICHVITRLIVGGAQENTLLTCAGLHERGHQVMLVTGAEAGPEGSLLEQARSGGYDVRVLPAMRRAVNPWRDYRVRRELTDLFRQRRPEVVHTHSSKAGILGRLAAHDAGVPIIVHTIHGMSFNRTQSWPTRTLYRRLEAHCARFTDRLITVADAMRDQAVAAGLASPQECTTVYSGMQTARFSPQRWDRASARQSWSVGEHEVVIGTIARLFRNKGYEPLIPAMAQAARRNPKIRFVWVGDGVRRDRYERQLERLGIRARVHLTGLITPQEVPKMLAGMDLLVHASQWEGLPRVAVQALLMERPVISFDIDGAPEVVIPGQTGLLVKLNDVTGLAEAMVDLSENTAERQRLGQAGRQLCLQRFDHSRMVDALEHIYKDWLSSQKRGQVGA